MNISKYIELLRFYITDKMDQLNQSLKGSLENEVEEVLSSILSAIFSLFISLEVIKTSGYLATILKIVIVIAMFFLLKFIIKKIRRYIKTYKEEKDADKSNISNSEAKSLVDKFDHIVCDGILLSRNYYKKYIDVDRNSNNEKWFYLFESFYYYKKALQIVALVIQYPEKCFNNANNINGISKYRFLNVFMSLSELQESLSTSIEDEKDIKFHLELKEEMSDTLELLEQIKNFLNAWI